MAMSKRNYEACAREIRDTFRIIQHAPSARPAEVVDGLAYRLASVFAEDNPRFDRSRFLAACRGEDATDSAGRTVHYNR